VTEAEHVLHQIEDHGLVPRTRMISGPQGPRVLLDGRPVLLLCSDNHLGLADHPRVREAAADAAMRYGAGAASPRPVSGTMRIHRRLEERLADFHGHETALLMGSRYLAGLGAIPALARAGEVVLVDAASHPSSIDGCRLAEAETFAYRHGDLEHLEWGLLQAGGRGSLIVTDGVFGRGDRAPLEAIVELARRHDARVLVDESHAAGTVGPDGRGAAADAGVEEEVDVLVGSLATSLGSYGGYVCCARPLARQLAASTTFVHSTAPAPPPVAAAMAALALLRKEPRRVEKLQRNAAALRGALGSEGLPPLPGDTHIVSVHVGAAAGAGALVERILERGIFVAAVVAGGSATLRLSVMASHTKSELTQAARTLARTVPAAVRESAARGALEANRPAAGTGGVFDGLAEAA
jgi:glycine C-acetyltransferase/8-amino-7-oxononanoate synthase